MQIRKKNCENFGSDAIKGTARGLVLGEEDRLDVLYMLGLVVLGKKTPFWRRDSRLRPGRRKFQESELSRDRWADRDGATKSDRPSGADPS
jgi:hypothetical protein